MRSRTAFIVDNADLTGSPIRAKPRSETELGATQWVTHPDMHGNALLLIYRLMSCATLLNGIEEKTSGLLFWKKKERRIQYGVLKEIYLSHDKTIETIKDTKHYDVKISAIEKIKKDVAEFKRILSKIEIKNKALAQRLIGDLLADRGANDYFTLLVLDHLKKNGVTVEIIFSNHDAAFIEAHEKKELRDDLTCKRYIGNSDEPYSKSLNNLRTLLAENIVTEEEIITLVENSYKPNLKLISYDVCGDDFTFYTHAPVDFSVIADMAAYFKVDYNDDTQENFCKSVDLINAEFSKSVMSGEFKTLLDEDSQLRKNFEMKLNNEIKTISENLLRIILKEKIETKLDGEQTSIIRNATEVLSEPKELIEYANDQLKKQNKMSTSDIATSKNLIIELNKLIQTLEWGHCRNFPLHTFMWSRIEHVIEVEETKPDQSQPIITHYQWPKTGWKSKAVNAHGHTGTNRHVKQITENNEVPNPSNHFDNGDNSNFGKTDNDKQGKMIMHFSINTRPYPTPSQAHDTTLKTALF